MGSTKKLRQGMSPLPFIKDAQDQPCRTSAEALERRISFFSDMEGGMRISFQEQRKLWIQNLDRLRRDAFELSIEEIPTLTELEQACRRVATAKASGMDGTSSGLLRCPTKVAKLLYSLLLKVGVQGQEPLEHKGGFLIPIWKGKQTRHQCSAFRSILISSMLGKSLHRTLRSKQFDLYHQ